MARHHRNLDDWEAERGITMGHTHPPVHHNVPEAGSLATGKAVAKAAAARRSATPRRGRQNIGPALLPIRADLSEGVAELKPQQNQCIGWPPSARLHAVGLRADHPAHTARPTGIDLWRVGAWRVGAGIGLRSRQGPGARVDLRTRRTVGAGVELRGSRDLRVDLWRPGGAGVMIGMR